MKVAEGCDYTCAFCIIPTLRGTYRSRTADSIVREARSLAERGVRELLLISQDTTFYGIDRGERGGLARLLRELNAIDGLEWIRLLYLYPTTITDDVLAAMAECEKVCRYVDLPLQHASASVLKRMRRPGNRATYDRLLARIRERVPGVTLRTTLIVGFPGESDEDFSELSAFVGDIEFDHVGVFTYSHEEGTRAFALPDDVPASLKRKRRARADVAAEAHRQTGAAAQDRDGGPGDGRRGLARARAGDPGTSGRTRPGHRPCGLPHGLRSGRDSGREPHQCSDRRVQRLRPDCAAGRQFPVASFQCYIYGWQLRVRVPKWACAHFFFLGPT